MNTNLHSDANQIIKRILSENMPQDSVRQALERHEFRGNIYMVAIGKAAWTMAKAASDFLGAGLIRGIVITKYDHCGGAIPNTEIIEAGHPLSDENTIIGTEKVISMAEGLTAGDELLFLISGGGSALFESPREGISLEDIVSLNNQLLASGADIVEMNMIRKRLSKVKGGRFAEIVAPARLFSIVLSDVLGDRLDSIASGPATPDLATTEDVQRVISAYKLKPYKRNPVHRHMPARVRKSSGSVFAFRGISAIIKNFYVSGIHKISMSFCGKVTEEI